VGTLCAAQPPVQKRLAVTRERLEEAALALFGKKGFEGTSKFVCISRSSSAKECDIPGAGTQPDPKFFIRMDG
jgi:hypothetical protein